MALIRRPTWIAIVAACAARPGPSAVRFANAPPVWVVNDRLDVPSRPDTHDFHEELDFFDESVVWPVARALDLPRGHRALGVNAVDEVPDSTWFTNRIGLRDLTPEEVGNGPLTMDSPELHKPWTVLKAKSVGTSPGLMVLDARGVKFMLKFDGPGEHELESGTHVVVNRLLWACGYHVAEDRVVYFRTEDLVLGHSKHGPTQAELADQLAAIEHERDGSIRALASRWLDGTPLGSPPREGVRARDPNDRIPHQLRRDLRGEYSILAWLDHVDDNRGNFIDFWVSDPRNPKRRYVEHYQIDFGRSFGGMAEIMLDLRHGHVYSLDWGDMVGEVATLGIATRPWGHHLAPKLRGVSESFTAADFDPGGWKPDIPYPAFVVADRFDKLWGAKLVSRFSREQIEAAVAAGQFSDPRASAYLVNTLVARQRATAAYWFARAAPLDRFATVARDAGVGLCFDDLAIRSGLTSAEDTRYRLASSDTRGHLLGATLEVEAQALGGTRTCTPQIALTEAGDGYTIVAVTIVRPGYAGTIYVHVARDARTGTPRVIGIWRT